jgi:hypothetical protein
VNSLSIPPSMESNTFLTMTTHINGGGEFNLSNLIVILEQSTILHVSP